MSFNRRNMLAVSGAVVLGGAARSGGQITDLAVRHVDGRETSYRVLVPDTGGRWPVVLFSHGANSSNQFYDRLLSAWVKRGFLVIAPNHLDHGGPADPTRAPLEGLWSARVADLRLPLDQPAAFDAFAHSLGRRIDWTRVAAAGHSLGAVVAQALAGARLIDPKSGAAFDGRDARVSAVVTFSPPGPRPNLVPANAWDGVAVPALLQTGDADRLPGFIDDWRQHKAGFDPRQGQERWLLIGAGVDHYFGGLICRLKDDMAAQAQGPALRAAAAVSRDFLRAHLADDRDAARRLDRAAAEGTYDPVVTLRRL